MTRLILPSCQLYNLYTTKEASSILSVCHIIEEEEKNEDNIMSIGKQLAIPFSILDARNQPVWERKSGQLHIAGIPTGDVLSYNRKKRLFYLGSINDQLILENNRSVNIHSIARIILDGGTQFGVIACLLKKVDTILIAYLLVPQYINCTQEHCLYAIWTYCHYNLQNAFVRNAWSIINAHEWPWPLDRFGVVDWLSLSSSSELIREIPWPRYQLLSPLEQKIRLIFAQVLHFSTEDEVNVDVSFLENVGASSLLALQAISKIRNQIYPMVDVFMFYSNPSVIQLAKTIEIEMKNASNT